MELRSFCVFSKPIQVVGRDRHCDEIFSRVATSGTGSNSRTSSSGSESNGQSRGGSPDVCKTPERQQESAYTQLAAAQPAGSTIYPGGTGPPQQAFAFDFDFDSGFWISADPYFQPESGLPKDQPDWLTQGLNFPGQFV